MMAYEMSEDVRDNFGNSSTNYNIKSRHLSGNLKGEL